MTIIGTTAGAGDHPQGGFRPGPRTEKVGRLASRRWTRDEDFRSTVRLRGRRSKASASTWPNSKPAP